MNEIELLFTEILKCNRPYLYLNKELHLDEEKSAFISSVLKRRMAGEPLPYILGKTEFMGLEFKLNPAVFIPRPETEILVEKILELVTSHLPVRQADKPQATNLKIMDIGTGSGNIAISLAKFLPNVKITATDISQEALNIAQENAQIHGVADKIRFIKSDLFTSLPICHMPYAICVTNPPYIPTSDIDNLAPEVKREPRAAIDGGGDGLDFYRCISRECAPYLKKGGLLVLEMGFGQKDALKNIFQKSGDFQIIDILKDYNNINRVIVAEKWIN